MAADCKSVRSLQSVQEITSKGANWDEIFQASSNHFNSPTCNQLINNRRYRHGYIFHPRRWILRIRMAGWPWIWCNADSYRLPDTDCANAHKRLAQEPVKTQHSIS